VTFLRGYEDGSATPPKIDWNALAMLGGTVVCYAGPQQLPDILKELLSGGFAQDEPRGHRHDGTLPTQQTIEGTLQELAESTQPPAQARDSRRGPRGRVAPASALVRRAAALPENASCDAVARPGLVNWSTCWNRWERNPLKRP
jgi:hypothetical protein